MVFNVVVPNFKEQEHLIANGEFFLDVILTSHAVAGGVISSSQGGKFVHGFISVGVTKGFGGAFLPGGGNLSGSEIAKGTIISAVIGGTASALSGGKFANGARTAAYQYLFNQVGRMAKPKKLAVQKRQQLLLGAKYGHITLAEAKARYKYGSGVALTADLSRINFGTVSAADFPNGVGSSEFINLFFKDTPDGKVFGTIRLTLTSSTTVEATAGFDIYDFNIDLGDGRYLRNVFTFLGETYHGAGTSFRINLVGTGTLNP